MGAARQVWHSGYDRRVLHEDPGKWSLALIVLQPGQQTDPHNHGGWGGAVTVQGVERDRRFVYDGSGNLVLSGERDYPPGTGYLFNPSDVHQPVGGDPGGDGGAPFPCTPIANTSGEQRSITAIEANLRVGFAECVGYGVAGATARARLPRRRESWPDRHGPAPGRPCAGVPFLRTEAKAAAMASRTASTAPNRRPERSALPCTPATAASPSRK